MRYLCLTLLLLSVTSVAFGQSTATPTDASRLEVIKFSWSKERINWEHDPFGGPIENFDEMRARSRIERQSQSAKQGGKVQQDAKADAANLATLHKTKPSEYVFTYKTTVRNLSNKTIKSVDWDYIFFDKSTNTELGRQQFTSEEKISPGKSKELVVAIRKPPTHTISVTALNKGEAESLIGRIVILGVQYSDGSSWQAPQVETQNP
jgi:hypothetical protein